MSREREREREVFQSGRERGRKDGRVVRREGDRKIVGGLEGEREEIERYECTVRKTERQRQIVMQRDRDR